MKKLRKKRAWWTLGAKVCGLGGTWMMIVTICQIVQSAERVSVGGFVAGMLAALAYGLCALLLWSYSYDLTTAAKRATRRLAKMEAEEMYAAMHGMAPMKPDKMWKKCG